jgi:hypothetical protein
MATHTESGCAVRAQLDGIVAELGEEDQEHAT